MEIGRHVLVLLLVVSLILSPVGCAQRAIPPKRPFPPAIFEPLQAELQKSYDELFRTSTVAKFSLNQVEAMRQYLDGAREYCAGRFRNKAKKYGDEINRIQRELKRKAGHLEEARRHDLHCRLQNLQVLKSEAEVLAKDAIPVAYENRKAKLDLIVNWPAELQQIRQEIATGAYHGRQFGDVQDIGFREIASGQEKDIKTGQEAIQDMKRAGLLPPGIENEAIRKYVVGIAEKIASHSDLRVPAKIAVLNSKEINAFSLPGGFLFVERGLLEAVDDEAQLAGVLAHEMAHTAGRHGHRLMKRAKVAAVIYQAAQIATLVLTGGVATIGTYYALQYGFYGLGLVLNLNLLGVSRGFELEADALGVQYAWNSGYDPSGFVRFFDKMATREGYVNGASWFRTHPPFYERMIRTEREILFLPKKEDLVVQTSAFEQMKKELVAVTAKAAEEEKNRPSLLAPEKGCPPPEKIEYTPGAPIETLCSPAAAQEDPD